MRAGKSEVIGCARVLGVAWLRRCARVRVGQAWGVGDGAGDCASACDMGAEEQRARAAVA